MQIDIVLCTKNSASKVDRFQEYMERAQDVLPVNKVVNVDSSNDSTTEIINEVFDQAEIIIDDRGRGKAREIGLKNCSSEWALILDDDVKISEQWWRKQKRKIQEGVGGIQSRHVDHYNGKAITYNVEESIERRALTHASLVRTEAVQDISIPEDLVSYEDEYIRRWVEDQGYSWILGNGVIHHFPNHSPAGRSFKKGWIKNKFDLIPAWKMYAATVVECYKKDRWLQTLGFTKGFASKSEELPVEMDLYV